MVTQDTTKVVGFRVPMPEYVQLLQSSMAAKLSLSDYVLSKLYADDKVAQLSDQLKQQAIEIAQVKKQLADSKALATRREQEAEQATGYNTALVAKAQKDAQERERLQKQVSTLTQEAEAVRRSERQAISGRSTAETDVARLTKELTALAAQNDSLTKQVLAMKQRAAGIYKKLDQVHDRTMLGAINKEAWRVLEALKNFG